VLVLHGDLRSFLVSVLKKGEACKAFVRTQYNIFGLDSGALASIPEQVAPLAFPAASASYRHVKKAADPRVRRHFCRTFRLSTYSNV
jgi:hypothetical protein